MSTPTNTTTSVAEEAATHRAAQILAHIAPAATAAEATASAAAATAAAAPCPVRSGDAHMYPSGQMALFSKKITVPVRLVPSNISQLALYEVPSLCDYLTPEQLGECAPNCFVRTSLDPANRPPRDLSGSQVIANDEVILNDVAQRSGLQGIGLGASLPATSASPSSSSSPSTTTTTTTATTATDALPADPTEASKAARAAHAFVRAGMRSRLVWQTGEVVAAVVTCGGLCPGLNDVVGEVVKVLHYHYGVDTIYGIRNGYRGFYDVRSMPWLRLTPDSVAQIHREGGTYLGSSRGGFDCEKIISSCLQMRVNQIYIVGGDGTHRAAFKLYEEARRRKLKLAIAGVPKTIDNDIGVIDRSFGFHTAIDEARKAVMSARVEASCTPNGVGIVKLMGRESGFIAAHATIATREVDLCLVPEVPFTLDGRNGIFAHLERVLQRRGNAVVVVAEGAGQDLLQSTHAVDESGNRRLADIGHFLSDRISRFFKARGTDVSIKYHDPSYMIRSVPANAADSIYCMVLAQNAVHGAMAGFTGFTSAQVNNRTVLLPIELISATSPTKLSAAGRTWERVISTTQQFDPRMPC